MRSMTGFGSSFVLDGDVTISVEIKCVNHRFFEFSTRLPHQLLSLEERLRKFVQASIARGKVDLFVRVSGEGALKRELLVDWALVEQLKEAASLFGRSSLMFRDVLLMPDVVTVRDISEQDEKLAELILQAVDKALGKVVSMRQREGDFLAQDLERLLILFSGHAACIRKRAPIVVNAYRERLEKRVQELTQHGFDEGRIVTEVALMAEKTDVHEELARLDSHCSQFGEILALDEPVGRRLDFLIQEMNREVNTIGSKGQDIEMTKNIVELKNLLEKMREQVQNIE